LPIGSLIASALRRHYTERLAHAYQFGYAHCVSHVASYDLLIDEKWQDGQRRKARWQSEEAELAVKETVAAASSLATQRRRLRGVFGHPVGLALSAVRLTHGN
jgi:hypothetical protein